MAYDVYAWDPDPYFVSPDMGGALLDVLSVGTMEQDILSGFGEIGIAETTFELPCAIG